MRCSYERTHVPVKPLPVADLTGWADEDMDWDDNTVTHAPASHAEALNGTVCGDWSPGDRVLGPELPGVTEVSCSMCSMLGRR